VNLFENAFSGEGVWSPNFKALAGFTAPALIAAQKLLSQKPDYVDRNGASCSFKHYWDFGLTVYLMD
jgi:hypothetical protein